MSNAKAEAEDDQVAELQKLLQIRGIRPNLRGELCERDAAAYLGCTVKTMYNMRRRGDGPRFVHMFGRYWYPLDGLAEYVVIRLTDGA